MSNVNYTSSSIKGNTEQNATSAEKKKVEKVISGTATRKPDAARKFTNLFAPGDMSSIKEYIVMDIVIPAVKKMVSEVVRNGIDMLMWGDAVRTITVILIRYLIVAIMVLMTATAIAPLPRHDLYSTMIIFLSLLVRKRKKSFARWMQSLRHTVWCLLQTCMTCVALPITTT